jgi:hypothetical protein
MEIGAVNEQVEVTAQASVLDTESATAGHVVQSRQILELPLLGRNLFAWRARSRRTCLAGHERSTRGPDQHVLSFDQRRAR